MEFLHIVPTPTEPFKVMVGNIAYIEYAGFCPNIPLVVQIVTFQVPFYIFPIQGVDVVIGVQLLQTLGLFEADFTLTYFESHILNILFHCL